MPTLGDQIVLVDSFRPVVITDQHRQIAEQLAVIHGKVRLAREASGIHLYCASPICLEKYGLIELHKMHLAVNLDKAIGGIDLCGQCMKSGKAYKLSTLLKMPPLSARGIQNIQPEVQEIDNNEDLEPDGKGNMIPKRPGTCIPLVDLPPGHAALEYVKYRGFDPEALYRQFRASYCSEERQGSFWSRLPGGFKNTPQGRIVFFIDVLGVQRGWQARIMEIDRRHIKYCWHPYQQEWVAVMERESEEEPWSATSEYSPWTPAKYLFGRGLRRNSVLMGYDSAVQFNENRSQRYCILTEGALDAAKFGPPGMAILGKSFSHEQARLVAERFDVVISIADRDEAGAAARTSVMEGLSAFPHVKFITGDLPVNVKDAGDIGFSTEQAQALITECLTRAN